MATLRSRCGHYIFALWFLSSFFYSSPNLSRCRLDVYRTSTHDVALVRIWNACLKCAACSSLKIQDAKIAKNLPSGHHHITYSGYILATKARIDNPTKNLLNSNISPTCPHNIVNCGPLVHEIFSLVWGTPANFSGFLILASLLQRLRSMETNQTLHYVWPSRGLVHYVYVFGGSCPLTEFCQVQNSLCIQVLRFPVLAVLLRGIA